MQSIVKDEPVHEKDKQDKHFLPSFSDHTMHLEDHGLNNPTSFQDACSKGVDSFVLRNISRIYANGTETLEGGELYMVVSSGKITCLGSDCDRDHVDWPTNSPVFEMNGAVVIPVRKKKSLKRKRLKIMYIFL